VGGRGIQHGGDGGHGAGFDVKLIAEQSYKFGNITGSLPLFFFWLMVCHSNIPLSKPEAVEMGVTVIA
jgi:hypothetical protein